MAKQNCKEQTHNNQQNRNTSEQQQNNQQNKSGDSCK